MRCFAHKERLTSEWGSEGREFKSHRPDHFSMALRPAIIVKTSIDAGVVAVSPQNSHRYGYWPPGSPAHAAHPVSSSKIFILHNKALASDLPPINSIWQFAMRRMSLAGVSREKGTADEPCHWQESHLGRKHWASAVFHGILGGMIRWLNLALHLAVAGLKSRRSLLLEMLALQIGRAHV